MLAGWMRFRALFYPFLFYVIYKNYQFTLSRVDWFFLFFMADGFKNG
jgi:hypothetical protein